MKEKPNVTAMVVAMIVGSAYVGFGIYAISIGQWYLAPLCALTAAPVLAGIGDYK